MIHGTLFTDLAWLDPRSFDNIRTTTLPNNAFEVLSRCLMKFKTSATVDNLKSELKCLAGQWNRLKASHLEDYKTKTVEYGAEGQEEETDIVDRSCAS